MTSHTAREVAQHQALGRTADARQFSESNARYLATAAESGTYPHLTQAMAARDANPSSPDEVFEAMLARVISGLG